MQSNKQSPKFYNIINAQPATNTQPQTNPT